MVVMRILLVGLIAISVVLLPTTGEAILATSSVEISMTHDADMPCCPRSSTHDSSKAICALKCMAPTAVCPAMTLANLYLTDSFPLPFVDNTLHGFMSSPPTHPPPL